MTTNEQQLILDDIQKFINESFQDWSEDKKTGYLIALIKMEYYIKGFNLPF